MGSLQDIFITDFLSQERDVLQKTEEDLECLPMSHEQKIEKLESLVKRGIMFGIDKGVFIETERTKKINGAKKKAFQRNLDEMIFSINDQIHKYQNQPKIKYSKRKYRNRKNHVQLNLLRAFGFISDPI